MRSLFPTGTVGCNVKDMNTATQYTVTYIDATGEHVKASFTDSRDAWLFMRLCDSLGVSAGYPARLS